MSLFQCENCGCMENTACGWYWCRNSKRLTPAEHLGKPLCSVCAPQQYADGSDNEDMNGKWHGRFDRKFFEKGMYVTNKKGNLEHRETGELATLSKGADEEINV